MQNKGRDAVGSAGVEIKAFGGAEGRRESLDALCVDVPTHGRQVADVSSGHAFQSACAAENRSGVRRAHPVTGPFLGEQHVDAHIDSQNVGNSLQRFCVDVRARLASPSAQSSWTGQTQKLHLFILCQVPGQRDLGECADGRTGEF